MKTGNFIINLPLLSNATCHAERPSSPSDKIWRIGDFKNPSFQTLQWIAKDLEVQPRLFKNPNLPSILWIAKKRDVCKPQEQHFKIQIFNLWMKWGRNLTSLLKISIRDSHKKGWSHFKFKISDWNIPFHKILRIYQWIGKTFSIGVNGMNLLEILPIQQDILPKDPEDIYF